jgi:hypothetical protein
MATSAATGLPWIRAHWLAVARFDSRLLSQLLTHCIQDGGLLPSRQYTQMVLGIGGVVDTIGQCSVSWPELNCSPITLAERMVHSHPYLLPVRERWEMHYYYPSAT